MHILIKLTQILPPLLIGFIIGGAISGNTSLLVGSIILLVADIIIGISLQAIYDKLQRTNTQGNWTTKDAEALQRAFIEMIKKDNDNDTHFDKGVPSRDEFTGEDRSGWDDICNKFERAYSDLEKHQGVISAPYHKAVEDVAGAILLDVCNHLPHAPLVHTLWNLCKIYTDRINTSHVLVYKFLHRQSSICENAYIFLVHHRDTIRLFAVETDLGPYVLCEYYGYRHINYGRVRLEEIATKIEEIFAHG